MLLHQLARAGSANYIELLLRDDSVNLNAVDSKGNTALHVACLSNRVSVVRCLLANRADASILNQKQ
eukprot:11547-Heterococcus_DN1.PRE.1